MKIRKYIDADLDKIVHLYIDIFSNPPWNEKWEESWVKARIKWLLSMPNSNSIVAEIEGNIVGALFGKDRPFKGNIEFDIEELFVLKIFNLWDPITKENYWEALIEVPTICSLYDFHMFIQRTIQFDNDHLFKFFAGRNERNRKLIFTDQAGYPHDGGDYNNIQLKDIYPLKRLKLFYLFDFGDNWIFEIHKMRNKATVEKGRNIRVLFPKMEPF